MNSLGPVAKSERSSGRDIGLAALLVGGLVALPHAAAAHDTSYRMPQEICEVLREVPLRRSLLNQIIQRPDYLDILQYADENCGGLVGLLMGATGSIPRITLASERSGQSNVSGTGTSPGTGAGTGSGDGTGTGAGTGTGGSTGTGGGTGAGTGSGGGTGAGVGNGDYSDDDSYGSGNGSSSSDNSHDD